MQNITRHQDVSEVFRHRHRALRSFIGVALACAIAFVALCSGAQAQTLPAGTPHSVTLSWVAPSPVGGSGTISGYNMYKSVAGGAYVKINAALIAGLTTVDAAVTSGQILNYCATTVDTLSEESACSNAVAVTVPSNPNPPVLSKPVVALNVTGNKETLTATWTDAPGSSVAYVIWNGTKILQKGVVADPKNTGSYSISWNGKAQPTYVEVFDVTTADQPVS
jgi:hypothetical protein